MSDFELTLKVRNAKLLHVMKERGYDNAAQLARAAEVSPSQIGDMLNLKEPALNKRGEIRSPVNKVMDLLSCSVFDIYPEDQVLEPLKQNEFKTEVSKAQLQSLTRNVMDPLKLLEIDRSEECDTLAKILEASGITSREVTVLYNRMNGVTLEDVGCMVGGVSRDRVRQLEARALRKMRHPSRTNNILDAAGAYSDEFESERKEAM